VAFRSALEQTGILDPVAHTSYLINLASPDPALWRRSLEAMVEEVERCRVLGITDLVVHPGAHKGAGEDAGLSRIAAALDEVHGRTEGWGVIIALEPAAGRGTTRGYRCEPLRDVSARVGSPERRGVWGDPCHIFAAGYPLDRSEEYHETIDRLDRCVGLD